MRDAFGRQKVKHVKAETKRREAFPLLCPLLRRDEQQDFLWNKGPGKDKGWTAGERMPDIEEERESVDQILGEREGQETKHKHTLGQQLPRLCKK